MPTFQAIPVEVEGQQWDGTQLQAAELVTWILEGGMMAYYEATEFGAHVVINTLCGPMYASPTDWVVKGPWGFRPERDDILPLVFAPV